MFLLTDGSATVLGLNVTLWAAVLAALAALVAAGFSYRGVRATNRAAEAESTRSYRVQQLNQLYGPLYMRRRLSRQLYRQLPGIPDAELGVTEWKLIDHIEEIKVQSGDHRRLIVEKILQINEELSDLIIGSAGLLERFPPPKSFETFLEHATLLRLNWERGANASGAARVPFPPELDVDIPEAIIRLREGLDPGAGVDHGPGTPGSSVTSQLVRGRRWRQVPR
jgi:hypothetical protein